MNNKEPQSNNTQSSTLFIIFVVLLILKLSGTILWPWWIVTLPLWIGIAIIAIGFGLGATLLTLFGLLYAMFVGKYKYHILFVVCIGMLLYFIKMILDII